MYSSFDVLFYVFSLRTIALIFLWVIYPCCISDMDLTDFENDFRGKECGCWRLSCHILG